MKLLTLLAFHPLASSFTSLILQNAGGGHGEIGYHLATELVGKGCTKVVLLQDAAHKQIEPFVSYPSLPATVTVETHPFDDTLTAEKITSLAASVDYVFDNVSKDPSKAPYSAFLEYAKSLPALKTYAFVSSAGMYTPLTAENIPLTTSTPTKETAQRKFEEAAAAASLPLVAFRPQYIYGPKASKNEYLDWFFDRIVAGKPLLIPGDGTQKISLTDCRDVAGMIASVCDSYFAAPTVFNCGAVDVSLSYNDVAELCAKTCGKTAEIKNFVFLGDKGSWPFRPTPFFVEGSAAVDMLGWDGGRSLEGEIESYWENYGSRDKKQLNFDKDEALLRLL